MKKIISFVFCLCLVFTLAGCGDKASSSNSPTDKPSTQEPSNNEIIDGEFSLKCNFECSIEGDAISFKVSNSISDYSFINAFEIPKSYAWELHYDKSCLPNLNIVSKTVDLEIGDNTFYALFKNKNNVDEIRLYTINIRRKPIYTVSFNTNGGSFVNDQFVEEDSFATEPNTAKEGYEFIGWDFDFKKTIIENITINAIWDTVGYTISYDVGNGKNNSSNPTKYTTEDNIILQDPISPEGYIFGGWELNGVIVNSIPKGTSGNIVLKAIWNPIFELEGGKILGFTEFGKDITELVIPSKIDNVEIVELDYYAFKGNRKLTKVVIPSSIKQLVAGEFSNCTSLKTVEIPDSIELFDRRAFEGCTSLTYTIEGDVKYLGNSNNKYLVACIYNNKDMTSLKLNSNCKIVGNGAFYYCNSLSYVELNEGLEIINNFAFYGCTSLTSISLPNSVKKLCFSSFCYTGLRVISIGDNLEEINDSVFNMNKDLFRIFVSDKNKNFKVVDYNLYSRDGKTLIQYAIGNTATSFSIPNEIITLARGAIMYSDHLKEVHLSKNIKEIGREAFYGCKALTTIYFEGTVTEWYQITKGENWNYGSDLLSTVVCSDGTVNLK